MASIKSGIFVLGKEGIVQRQQCGETWIRCICFGFRSLVFKTRDPSRIILGEALQRTSKS